jgi:hypothetical protein
MTRRRTGFLTISRISFDHIDKWVPGLGTRYTFYRLLSFVDERQAKEDEGVGRLRLSGRELARMMNVPESTFRGHLDVLVEIGLIVRQTEYPGQLTIPGFAWHAAWEHGMEPLLLRIECAASARPVRDIRAEDDLPPGETKPLDVRDVRDARDESQSNKNLALSERKARVTDTRTLEEKRALTKDPRLLALIAEEERQRREATTESDPVVANTAVDEPDKTTATGGER